MAQLITKTEVYTALNNLMGRRAVPSGYSADLELFCQEAFKYAWRYYKWGFSLRRATIDLTDTPPYMPADFDLDGYHEVLSAVGQPWTYVPIDEYDSLQTGERYYTLEFDPDENKYKFVTSFTAEEVNIIYQVEPPTLSDTGVPFPSALSVAIGAEIYAKAAENPMGADISQEWDQFHAELDRHVGRADKNKPAQVRRTRQDKAGTYTGYVGGY